MSVEQSRIIQDMTLFTYARRWNGLTHNEIDPISETVARDLFAGGEEFFIAVQRKADTGAPIAFLEIGGNPVVANACRLDETERIDEAYSFQYVAEQGLLFLSRVTSYGYGTDEYVPRSRSDLSYTYYFKPHSDVVVIEEYREATGDLERSERHGVDLTHNWEPLPSFGDWEGLLRFERG